MQIETQKQIGATKQSQWI